MPTEKMRTPRKSTQSQPITPLKYMQVYVDAMRFIDDPGSSDCEPQDNNRGSYRLAPPHANEELRVGNQDCILHSPETLIPTSTASQTEDLDYMPSDTSIVASPEISQIVRDRKRIRNESSWKDMKRKKALNLGEEYTNRKGKVVGRKIMKAGCGTACRMQCHGRIDREQRETIFRLFWQTGSIDKRRMYICHNVAVKDKATGNATSRRAKSVKYHLEIDGEKIPVCKTFFLHTLGLSDQFVFTALSKKDEGGHISPDMRGRHK
ncbi:lish domain-containing [Plakobranchus ocellatus]|uniref:Lish domain-containing n=1 Tax=Plakobranchus ocellatus TaxID=259542 RepID=A0AAV4DXA3_9GAST|nr:lish domain-containing [Plakobranchus ocellatus]